MTTTQHDADQLETESLGEEMTLDHLADIIEQVQAEDRYAGPSPLLVRTSAKQSWAQAKRLDALKDMAPKRLADWVEGLNEVAGFAKYRVA